jgi:hypothetical protein
VVRRFWLEDGVWAAVLLGLLVFVVASASGRALDPIIDTGRDLYIPEQIRQGAKLYRDVLYYYPPLTPYALAAITSVTGSSLRAYTGIGASIALLTMAALYTLGRVAGSARAGGTAALLFAACSVYSVSGRTSNYFFPYAHAATLAMLFFLCGGAFLLVYAYRGRNAIAMALALTSLLAASWTKLEFVVFSAVLLVAFAIVHRLWIGWLGAYALVGGLSFFLVDRFFRDVPDERHWLFENVLAPSLLNGASARLFYRRVAGFEQPVANLQAIVVGALLVAACVGLVRWADRANGRTTYAAVAIVISTALVFGGAAFFRSWALLQFALIPFALRRPRDPLLILLVMSLCASSRVLLRLFPSWYGFVFIVPTYVLIAHVVFDWLPERGVYSRRAALLWIAPLVVLAAQFLWTERQLLQSKTHAVNTPRGTYFDDNPHRASVVSQLVEHLGRNRAQTLVVAPEGLALNYLARVATPLTFHTFTPVETADRDTERRIVEELASRKPERIAIVARDVSDFGYRGFGIDYNRNVAELIRERYVPEKKWQLAGFELLLLRRSGQSAR